MSDGRANNGGARPGSGRRPKPVVDDLHERLRKALRAGRKNRLDDIFAQLAEDAVHKSFTIRHKARTQLLAYFYGTPIPRVAAVPEPEDNLAPPIGDAIERIYGGDGGTDTGG